MRRERSMFETRLLARVEAQLKQRGLSRREREIALLVVQGMSNRDIGERCYLSEQTIKDHVKHVFMKCGIHNRTRLLPVLLGIAAPGDRA